MPTATVITTANASRKATRGDACNFGVCMEIVRSLQWWLFACVDVTAAIPGLSALKLYARCCRVLPDDARIVGNAT